MKILIVEDELDLLTEIKEYLSRGKYVCETAANFDMAESCLAAFEYDIAIIDITLPGGSGLELIKLIKKIQPETGIIIVSAKNSLDDKVVGLELGADDYITKPFHLTELNARIKALIRRQKFSGSNNIIYHEIEVIDRDNVVLIAGKSIYLTKKEYELLVFFIANKNHLITRESIAEHLWGNDISYADNFDFIYTHINNLRKKIQQAGGRNYITSVYGMGYKFSDL